MSDLLIPVIKTRKSSNKNCTIVKSTYNFENSDEPTEDPLKISDESLSSEEIQNGDQQNWAENFLPTDDSESNNDSNGLKVSLLSQKFFYDCVECGSRIQCKYIIHNFHQGVSYICTDKCMQLFCKKHGFSKFSILNNTSDSTSLLNFFRNISSMPHLKENAGPKIVPSTFLLNRNLDLDLHDTSDSQSIPPTSAFNENLVQTTISDWQLSNENEGPKIVSAVSLAEEYSPENGPKSSDFETDHTLHETSDFQNIPTTSTLNENFDQNVVSDWPFLSEIVGPKIVSTVSLADENILEIVPKTDPIGTFPVLQKTHDSRSVPTTSTLNENLDQNVVSDWPFLSEIVGPKIVSTVSLADENIPEIVPKTDPLGTFPVMQETPDSRSVPTTSNTFNEKLDQSENIVSDWSLANENVGPKIVSTMSLSGENNPISRNSNLRNISSFPTFTDSFDPRTNEIFPVDDNSCIELSSNLNISDSSGLQESPKVDAFLNTNLDIKNFSPLDFQNSGQNYNSSLPIINIGNINASNFDSKPLTNPNFHENLGSQNLSNLPLLNEISSPKNAANLACPQENSISTFLVESETPDSKTLSYLVDFDEILHPKNQSDLEPPNQNIGHKGPGNSKILSHLNETLIPKVQSDLIPSNPQMGQNAPGNSNILSNSNFGSKVVHSNMLALNRNSGSMNPENRTLLLGSTRKSIRKCVECSRALIDPRFNIDVISWENLEFCDEECLEVYQRLNCSICFLCKIEISQNNYGKFSVKVSQDFKHFCSTKCQNDFKTRANLCFLCYENLNFSSKFFKGKLTEKFCSTACLEKYEQISCTINKNVYKEGICTYCKKNTTLFITFENCDVIFKFCTKTCFDTYTYLNKVAPYRCSNCQNFFCYDKTRRMDYNISYNHFCSNICKDIYFSEYKLILQCSWCKSVKYHFSMIKKNINNKQVAACSQRCLKLYQKTLAIFEVSKQECRLCLLNANNKFHVTMWDNTVISFCSRLCVDNYQKQLGRYQINTTRPITIADIHAAMQISNQSGSSSIGQSLVPQNPQQANLLSNAFRPVNIPRTSQQSNFTPQTAQKTTFASASLTVGTTGQQGTLVPRISQQSSLTSQASRPSSHRVNLNPKMPSQQSNWTTQGTQLVPRVSSQLSSTSQASRPILSNPQNTQGVNFNPGMPSKQSNTTRRRTQQGTFAPRVSAKSTVTSQASQQIPSVPHISQRVNRNSQILSQLSNSTTQTQVQSPGALVSRVSTQSCLSSQAPQPILSNPQISQRANLNPQMVSQQLYLTPSTQVPRVSTQTSLSSQAPRPILSNPQISQRVNLNPQILSQPSPSTEQGALVSRVSTQTSLPKPNILVPQISQRANITSQIPHQTLAPKYFQQTNFVLQTIQQSNFVPQSQFQQSTMTFHQENIASQTIQQSKSVFDSQYFSSYAHDPLSNVPNPKSRSDVGNLSQNKQQPNEFPEMAQQNNFVSQFIHDAISGLQWNTDLEELQIPVEDKEVQTSSIPPKIRQDILVRSRKYAKMMNKMTYCQPYQFNYAQDTDDLFETIDEYTQTNYPDLSEVVIPIPFPFYVPTSVLFGEKHIPIPFPMPVPIPVPIFLPMKQESEEDIFKEIVKIKETIPEDPLEAELIQMAALCEELREEEEKVEEVKEKAEDLSLPMNLELPHEGSCSSDSDEDLPLSQRIGKWKNEIKILKIEKVSKDGLETCFNPLGGKRKSGRDLERNLAKSSINKDIIPRRTSKRFKKNPEETISMEPNQEEKSSNSSLIVSYGINAWYYWFHENFKNTVFGSKNILDLRPEELNNCLSYFVEQIRKPSGQEYFPDTIFYLCLCIQKYLVENGKKDNIFLDDFYEKFISTFDKISMKFALLHEPSSFVITRVEEQFLWESNQLGISSPKVLLCTLIYQNTINFGLDTLDKHKEISFGRMIKCAKNKNCTFLRYYPPYIDKKYEKKYYEVGQFLEDSPKCPIKIFDFYISKCPDYMRRSNTLLYLVPEKYCTAESPVWFSNQPLSDSDLGIILRRIGMVKEVNMVTF